MREIKFRAWDTINKEFIPFNNVVISKEMPVKNIAIMLDGTIVQLGEDFINDIAKPGRVYFEGQISLQQWTNLLDKNGVEIYEGDILILPGSFGDNKDPYLVRVEWASSDSIHGWYVYYIGDGEYGGLYDSLVERGEVIGNIYSNPELLEEVI